MILGLEWVEEVSAAVVAAVVAEFVELAAGCNNSECATVDTSIDLQSAAVVAAVVAAVEGEASAAASN
eukprot:scaffold184739_cov22-Cyclotella_meneghiniana.AAC.1